MFRTQNLCPGNKNVFDCRQKLFLFPSSKICFRNISGADPGFSERGGCTDVGDLEGAARPLPTRGVWGHAPPDKFEI